MKIHFKAPVMLVKNSWQDIREKYHLCLPYGLSSEGSLLMVAAGDNNIFTAGFFITGV